MPARVDRRESRKGEIKDRASTWRSSSQKVVSDSESEEESSKAFILDDYDCESFCSFAFSSFSTDDSVSTTSKASSSASSYLPLPLKTCFKQTSDGPKKNVTFDDSSNYLAIESVDESHDGIPKEKLWWDVKIRETRKANDFERIETKSGVMNFMEECQKAYTFLMGRVLESTATTKRILITDSEMHDLLTESFMGGFRHSCRGMERLASRRRVQLVVQNTVENQEYYPTPDSMAESLAQITKVDRYWARLLAIADRKCLQYKHASRSTRVRVDDGICSRPMISV
jgi:hypothetical protein